MIFLYYVIIGLIIVMLRSIIFTIKCFKKGIKADIYSKFLHNYIDFNIWSILLGIIIWPIRVIMFNKNEKEIIHYCLEYKKELEELEKSE